MLMNVRLFILLSLTVAGLGLSACNTIEGAGRDIENTGEAVQDSTN